MQHAQQREAPERMSWARAMVFAVGFFFLAAILVAQLPGYVNLELTSSTLTGLEQAALALAAIGLGGFIVIQVIVLLFDPKPVVPPKIFAGLGPVLALAGLALILWVSFTNNQYFPHPHQTFLPLLGGTLLWFQPEAIDFVMIGSVILTIGVAMAFYGMLASRELTNPDRSDLGITRTVRLLLIAGIVILSLFAVFYTFVSDSGLAASIVGSAVPAKYAGVQLIIDAILNTVLGIAIFCTLGAFALRLHYLMRPVRKRTMSILYMVGINLAQVGVIFLFVWLLAYPLVAWIHSWSFIGLGDYLTVCGKPSLVPGSCAFSQQAGYIVDAIITTTTFALFMLAIWAWKGHRNAVIVGSVTITAVLALATLLTHLHPDQVFIAMLLCGGALVLAVLWTSVARREFAVVGEKNMGCLGQWLIVGTCLLIYMAAFAFFSLPNFSGETEPNVPFIPGSALAAPAPAGQPPVHGISDAMVMFLIMGILAAVQFYFLTRNRYKV